ncbi:MAG: hypothetical protein PHC87_04585 [Actinomycetota bacterium]|nr:hypothetical protein [Actinomycetota bacterium]
MIIRRYFSEDIFEYIKSDFGFLVNKIIQSGFEYDLQIRDNYFNLYYKGNSIGKISFNSRSKLYRIAIHNKFISKKIKDRFNPIEQSDYLIFYLKNNLLHPLFSSNNLLSIAQKVKDVKYKEETTFEQMLMTDNVNRRDLIIIDRQIADTVSRTKMDLLALSQIENRDNDYRFCVIEVKLGNNPELRGKVSIQLKEYVSRISNNFSDYKKCYEKNFKQKQELGLLSSNLKINIVPDVLGVVVVLGYSGIARKSIRELKEKDPEIKVLHLKNIIDLSKVI